MDDIDAVVAHATTHLALSETDVPDGYGHLGLCVIDAVYSIGIHYGGVRNVIDRYCAHVGITDRGSRNEPAPNEHTIGDLLAQYDHHGWEHLMAKVYDNRTWTSPSGRWKLRKAEAIGRFADVLHSHGIYSVADIDRAISP